MKIYIVSLICFAVNLVAVGAEARITDGKVSHKVAKDQIMITVEKGFHINEKAPMTFKFYVCDDKNTACEEHEIKPAAKK
jgi:hypothetical protein